MRAVSLAVLTVAVLTAGAAPYDDTGLEAQARSSAGEPCTFAVLRRDGIIVPFASYDGGRWLNRWPEPGRRIEIPISLDASPKGWWLHDRPSATWTAWPTDGESRAIHVRNPVNLTVECERHIGLQTDYSSTSPPVPRDMQPHPKDGLATTGDVLVDRVEVLSAASAEWKTVQEAIAATFTTTETKLLPQMAPAAARPASEQARSALPVVIEVLFASAGAAPGSRQFYFEAARKYPSPGWSTSTVEGSRIRIGAPPCGVQTFGAGWVMLKPGAAPKVTVTLEPTDCTRQDLLYGLPLGAFRLGDRRYWAVQRAGWGFERYEILEIADPEVKSSLKTAGGTCR